MKVNSNVIIYLPESFPQYIKDKVNDAGAEFIAVHKQIEICKNVYSTGELGNYIKEQSLIINTSKGLVLITGCAHYGIVKVIRKAKEISNRNFIENRQVIKEGNKINNNLNQKIMNGIYLVLGGFHLCNKNTSQIEKILEGVKKENVQKVAPSHCSGNLARQLFKEKYKDNFLLIGVGRKIKVENSF